MSVFLSATVNESVLEMRGETLVISGRHRYPDFEAWQINITGASADGKKLALYIKYYDKAGMYYTGSIGSRNWMYYSENEGEEYGTIPVWWDGDDLFIEEQSNNELGHINIIETEGYLEGTFDFKGFRSRDDYMSITEGKFKIPFSRE